MTRVTLMSAVIGATIAFTTTASLAAVLTHVPPNRTPNTPTSYSAPTECGEDFGFLFPVKAKQIAAIDDERRVFVEPVCEGDTAGSLASSGNAMGLRSTIGNNEVLVDVLAERSYTAQDVFGIRMGARNTVILYVHKYGN